MARGGPKGQGVKLEAGGEGTREEGVGRSRRDDGRRGSSHSLFLSRAAPRDTQLDIELKTSQH